MRRALILVGLVVGIAACESGNSWPEKAPSVEGMTETQACDAVRKRVYPCVDEVLVSDMAKTMEITVAEAEEIVKEHSRNSAKAVVDLTRNMCFGDPRFAASVAACWDAKDCKAFASCVSSETDKRPYKRTR